MKINFLKLIDCVGNMEKYGLMLVVKEEELEMEMALLEVDINVVVMKKWLVVMEAVEELMADEEEEVDLEVVVVKKKLLAVIESWGVCGWMRIVVGFMTTSRILCFSMDIARRASMKEKKQK